MIYESGMEVSAMIAGRLYNVRLLNHWISRDAWNCIDLKDNQQLFIFAYEIVGEVIVPNTTGIDGYF